MAITPKRLAPILPIRAVPDTNKIAQIKPIQPIQPVYGFNSIQAQKDAYYRNQKQIETFLANYNDPTELNSFIDALTNRAAVSKEFGDTWGTISTASGQAAVTARVAALVLEAAAWIASALLPDAGAVGAAGSAGAAAIRAAKVADTASKIAKGFNTASAILAIPAVPAATKVAYDYGIQPIMHGKPKEAGINMLMNLGETMDYTANPIKGLFLEGPEGFIKATGMGPDGRYNYDYDTGNVLTDMFLEIITDPMNWIDVGAAKGIKTLSTKAGKNLTDDLVLDIVPNINKKLIAGDFTELTEKQVKNIQKRMSNVAAELSREWSDLAVKNLDVTAKNALLAKGRTRLQRELVNAIRRQAPDLTSEQIMEILQKSGRDAYTKRFTKSALTKIQNVQMDTLAKDVIGHLSELQHYSDDFQKFLMKGALLTSGYGLGMEAVRKLYDPIVKWANNFTVPRLIKAGVLDPNTKKINIKDWTKFKSAWIAAHKYTTAITGEVTQRTEGTMFVFATQQFTEDMQVIRNTIIDNLDPAIREAKLDNYFTKMYGTTYAEYITYLKQINDMEAQRFKVFVDYAEQAQTTLTKEAGKVIIKDASKTIKQVFKVSDVGALIKSQQNVFDKIATAIKLKKGKVTISDDIYTIKLNDAFVNAILIEDPVILQVFDTIESSHGFGALLNKIIGDPNAYADIADARLVTLAREIVNTSKEFHNVRDLYYNMCACVFPKVKGVRDDQLKRYILDEIFGFSGTTVSELLASFDNITMPALASKLEVMMKDIGFKIADYPGSYEQIASVFKHFLQQCQANGVENFETVVAKSFTSNTQEFLNVLQQHLPDLVKEFQVDEIAAANGRLVAIMNTVRMRNVELLESVLSSKNTIFDVKNTRKLADYGIAAKTIATQDDLKLWNISKDMPNSMVMQMSVYGKSINRIYNGVLQYNKLLRKKDIQHQIQECYDKIYTRFIEKGVDQENVQVFKYLRYAIDPTMQFTQLAALKKIIQDDTELFNLFKQTLQSDVGPSTQLYLWIMNPAPLMTTDFAWEASSQIKWIKEKQFNVDTVNAINAYRNLGIMSEKLTGDFETMRDYLSSNALDRTKLIQQERYIKAATRINDTLNFLEGYYDSLFDKEIMQQQLERLYDVLLFFPELNTKYSELVDRLKKYWSGELPFAQDPIYEKEAAIAAGKEYVDEFTPFWEEIQQMNTDIYKATVQYNKELFIKLVANKLSIEHIDEYIKFINELDFTELNDISNLDKKLLSKYKERYIRYNTDGSPYKLLNTRADLDGTLKLFDILDLEPEVKADYARHLHEIQNLKNKLNEKIKYRKEMLARIKGPEKHNVDCVIQTFNKNTQQYQTIAHTTGRVTKKGLRITYVDENGKTITQVFPEAVKAVQQQPYQVKVKHTDNARYIEGPDGEYISSDAMLTKQAPQYTFEIEEYKTVSLPNKDGSFEDVELPNNLRITFKHIDNKAYQDAQSQQIKKMNAALHYKINSEQTKEMNNYLKASVKQHNALLNKNFKQLYREDLLNTYKAQRLHYKAVTPWDPMRKQQELNRAINKATDQNAKGTLYELTRLSPEQFEEELAFRHRFITFTQDDVADGQLKHMFKHFVNKIASNPNIKHVYDSNTRRHWFVLDKSQKVTASGRQYYINGRPLTRVQFKKQHGEFNLVDQLITDKNNPGITKTLDEWDNAMEELTGSRLGNSQGEFLDEKALEAIYAQMPDEVKALIDLEDITNKQFFEAYAFNESVLGTRASKQSLGMYSTNLIINMRNATVQAQAYLKPKVEYVNTAFDSMFSVGNPEGVFKNFSNEDILEALQKNPDYKLVALVDDKKYGMRTREILPTSVAAIQKARELGAVVLPLQVYKDMYNVVNHRLGSTGFAKWWNRIMYTYKFGYLLRPGAFIRNWIDTNLKSYLEMGDERKTYNELAHRIINDVDKMNDYVDNYLRQFDNVPAGSTIKVKTTRELQEEYFTNGSSFLSYNEFLELNRDFLHEDIAGTIMKDLDNIEGGDVWQTCTRATGRIIEMGNQTEKYNRLATYLYELDHGADYTGALAKLAHIHFDYSFKTKAEQLVEMVFPFTTFSLRNYSYWIQMIEKYPWLLRNYTHIMKPSWDFKDYTPEQLATDYRAQNQIISGQLKLVEFKDKLVTFKANPSIQDALQMFSNPINNVYEKLAAPISVPLALATGQYTQPANIIPVLGPMIQSAQTMAKTGTPMPSAIAVQPSSKSIQVKFKNKNTNKINQFRDKQYRVPKYRNNVVFDSYKTVGVQRYKVNMYPVIDIAHEIKSRYTTNVYARIKNRVTTDVYKGIRYRIKLDANRFR